MYERSRKRQDELKAKKASDIMKDTLRDVFAKITEGLIHPTHSVLFADIRVVFAFSIRICKGLGKCISPWG